MKISEWFAKHGRDMGSKVVVGIRKPPPPKIELDKIKDKLHTMPTIGIPKPDPDPEKVKNFKSQHGTGFIPPPGIKRLTPEQREAEKRIIMNWVKKNKGK